MINVSNEFWKTMQERTDFKENAEITLADGTVLELDESAFTVSNNSIADAAGVNSIPLGIAISRSIQIELMNDDKRFSTYDFFGAKIRLYLTFQLSESIERIEYGTFTVISPETLGTTVIITANDDMHKTNTNYNTNLTFPQKAWVVLQDCCTSCGILLRTTEFANADFEIQEKPSGDYTHRQIIGYIAMIAGGNARINRQGYLEILSYDFSFLNEVADGGIFNPWTEGDVLDGGLFTDMKDYHVLYNFKDSPRVDTDDVVITGVQTTIQPKDNETQTRTVLLGQEGYVLKIENPLIGGNEEDALQKIGAIMIGGRMRKFEGDHIAYPIAEFMDKAFVVDREGNTYGTILTDVNFTFFGFTTFKNSAENAVRNESRFSSQGTQAIIQAQKLVKEEKTQRELAVGNLATQLANSNGLYITTVEQADKSFIYYMHNKKTLAESDIVWKLTAQAFGISTDGGKTYPYGFTATGTAILDMIYAIGLNANHITTGRISDKAGKNYWDLVSGGFVTKDATANNLTIKGGNIELTSDDNVIKFRILRTNGTEAGYWSPSYFRMFSKDGGTIGLSAVGTILAITMSDGNGNSILSFDKVSSSISNATWLGHVYVNAEGRLQFHDKFGGDFKGWIGHNGTNNLYLINEMGGPIVVNNTIVDDGNYSTTFGVFNNQKLVNLYQAGGVTTGSKWLSPVTDGGVLLGASNYRWGQIYSTNSSITTSDRNKKKEFTEFDERYELLFEKLKPQLFKFKDGTSDRKHSGFISQDVEEAMLEIGLTDKDFAGFCKDKQKRELGRDPKTHEIFNEDVFDEDGNLVYDYSLRYEEFIALNTHMIQKLCKKVTVQQEEIEELKQLIKQLMN